MKGSEDGRMVVNRINVDERTDAELVAASHRGDAAATEALFVRYEGPIYRMALRMCRDPEDAKEVLQETLLAAARTLRDFRGDSAVGTWLYAIARSFCIKLRKKRSRGGGYDATDEEVSAVVDPSQLPDDAAAGHEVGAALQQAIAELSRPYREVLVLRDVEGLTAPEVAAALGIGVDAVKSRLHRARVAVRDKIAPLLSPPEPPPAHGDCPDVLHLFSQRLEGEVDANLCHEMEKHVAKCPHCSSACDSLKRTLALCTASAPSAPVPPAVQAKVRRALREVIRLEGG
jgi:RNA polymerase sigma-70 factor, ECF subfamily